MNFIVWESIFGCSLYLTHCLATIIFTKQWFPYPLSEGDEKEERNKQSFKFHLQTYWKQNVQGVVMIDVSFCLGNSNELPVLWGETARFKL